VAILVVWGGVYVSFGGKKDTAVMEKETANVDSAMVTKDAGDVMEKEVVKDTTVMTVGTYEAYSPAKAALASATHNVVLFFRAGWCPSCRAIDSDIKTNLSKIPSSLAILDVDYDNSSELKKKYGVTYQHTFVQVDKDGNLVKKWSGSPTLSALVSEIK
jgi:thiol-disulfide isomerase/thioredoxin